MGMIQHIGIEELKKLKGSQLDYLQEWYFERHKGHKGYTQADIVSYENHEVPLLTIGQLIEILEQYDYSGYKKIRDMYEIYDARGNLAEKDRELVIALFTHLCKVV